jgi:hypothetical protein
VTYLVVLVMAAIVLGLLWAWWAGRIGRDPAGTVDDFHRALAAMQPGAERDGERARVRPDADTGHDTDRHAERGIDGDDAGREPARPDAEPRGPGADHG